MEEHKMAPLCTVVVLQWFLACLCSLEVLLLSLEVRHAFLVTFLFLPEVLHLSLVIK